MASPTEARALLDELLDRVAPLAGRFAAADRQLHVVGGAVRDALLGVRHPGDLDLTTDARPEETLELVEGVAATTWTQGQRFGTIGVRVGEEIFEITTHRTESYDPGSRKPEVVFADALDEDLSRRDFTINAIALDVATGELADPHGGTEDLQRRVLRTPRSPEVSFTDDPLRVLRAGRFLTRFELTAVPALEEAAAALADRLAIVSAERVLDELSKLLATERPSRGLDFLARVGVLDRVLPEADPSAPVDDLGQGWLDRLAALLAGTETEAVRARLRALRLSTDGSAHVVDLVAALRSLPDAGDDGLGPSVVRRWVAGAGDRWRHALDVATVLRPGPAGDLRRAVDELSATEDLDDLSVPLDGDDVMAVLAVGPGPEVGRALALLRDHRLDHGPITRAEAEALLRPSP